MSREEAIKKLKVEQLNDNAEIAHNNADDILCEMLSALGFQDVVDEYEKVQRWYS